MNEIPGLDRFMLNFSDNNLIGLQLCIAFIMFSVALSIRLEHFNLLFKKPKPVIVGLTSQLILLPAITFLLIKLISPPVGVGMGMILVAVCPGGNVSNFYTLIARGNVALSVSLTAVISIVSIASIPFFFSLWMELTYPLDTSITLNISPSKMITHVSLIMGLPILIGLTFTHKLPKLARRISGFTKMFSFLILTVFIVVSLSRETETFIKFSAQLWPLVAFHNAVAFATGFTFAKLSKCGINDVKAICFETGIQNATIALALVFTFFEGNGSMAVTTAAWGVWHLIAGAALSALFLVKKRKTSTA